ncbi:MAG: D-TA family PLP-dependent enzyme [Anaerolineae bacterium]
MLEITRPTVLLNETIARRNIARMAAKASENNLVFRPHFKTHQSIAVGEWFREAGVRAITVSSMAMAQYFADAGWEDVLIAFPVNWREIGAINALAERIRLGLLLESVETAAFLSENLTAEAQVWLKVDTGYHRTGIAWDDTEKLLEVAQAVVAAPRLRLTGLLTHAGHTYHARGVQQIEAIHRETVTRLQAARRVLGEAGFAGLRLSLGDTPSCSVVEDLSGVDEIRPGNFVFYDMMQVQIGACSAADVAVAVACPVVAVHPRDRRMVIYGGGVHLSKEFMQRADGLRSYGAVALLAENGEGWGEPDPDATVIGLSQEHGIIQASDALLSKVAVGDLVAVLPVHSCMTVNLLKHYRTLTGDLLPMMGFSYGD